MRYSVIIPVYNAEKTLRRCLDSFLWQIRNDIEILIVNDGSTDESAKICKEYIQKSECFNYFEKENGGVSSARNCGLDKAIGDYILFVDSDDYVCKNYFAFLDGFIADFEYDYIICSGKSEGSGDDEKKEFSSGISKEKNGTVDFVCECICDKWINSPWAKAYKASVINQYNIRFPQNIELGEDRAFNISFAVHANSIVVCNKKIYTVSIDNTDSLSRKKRDKKQLDSLYAKSNEKIIEAIKTSDLSAENRDKLMNAFYFGFYCDIYSEVKRMIIEQYKKKDIHRYLKSECKSVMSGYPIKPINRFCKMIYYPIKFRLYPIIYGVGVRLAHGATI